MSQLLFIAFVVLSFRIWNPKCVVFSADVCAEKPFQMQVFYKQDASKKFNDEQTALATVNAGKSRVRVYIPSKRVQGVRVDLDSCPGRVSMSNMVLSGREDAALETGAFSLSQDIERSRIEEDGTLVVWSSKRDPYIAYSNPLDVAADRHFNFGQIWHLSPLVMLWFLLLLSVAKHVVCHIANIASRIKGCALGRLEYLDEERVVAFDFIRVVALVIVILAHVLEFTDNNTLPFRLRITSISWGTFGVSLFIFLSGAALSISSFKNTDGWSGYCLFYMKRLKALLPPFYVTYMIWLLFPFCMKRVMRMHGDWLKIVQTIFGIDGYFFNAYNNYYLIGEWYLGCVLMLYLFAPIINGFVRRKPILALFSFFAISAAAAYFTPVLKDVFPIWHRVPQRNAISRLFEFAAGISFLIYVRPHFRQYALWTMASAAYLSVYVFLAELPLFDFSLSGVFAVVAVFSVVSFVFDMVHISEPLKEAAEFFGRLSFLAFLHHHAVIFWLFRHSRIVSIEELIYAMLLVVTISYLLAYVSYKPAFVLARVIFGGARNRTSA